MVDENSGSTGGQNDTGLPPNPLRHRAILHCDHSEDDLRTTRTIGGRVKSIMWRASAAVTWIAVLSLISLRFRLLFGALALEFLESLKSWGFAPASPTIFFIAAATGWILLITGFRLLEVVGFCLYTLNFPVVIVFALVYGAIHPGEARSSPQPARRKRRRVYLPLRGVVAWAFCVWLVLYAESPSRIISVLGAVLVGLVFLNSVLSMLSLATPVGSHEAPLLKRIELFSRLPIEVGGHEERPLSLGHVLSQIWMFRQFHALERRLAIFLRHRRGEERVSRFVLLHYISSAVAVVALAVLFWATVARAVEPRSNLSLILWLLASASYFLPGVERPAQVPISNPWLSLLAGLSSWLLFVILLAPLANIIPMRQEGHAQQVVDTYRAVRRTMLLCRGYLKWLRLSKKWYETNEHATQRAL